MNMSRSRAPGACRSSRRRGFALTEMLVAVTSVAALLGLCAVTIQLMLRLSAESQARVASSMGLERLARQFRADVHRCLDTELVAEATAPAKPGELRRKLTLTLEPGRTVTYSPDVGIVVRTESLAGKTINHESYALGRSNQARFELRVDSPRRFLVLALAHDGARTSGGMQPIEVLAAPGKDRAAGRGENGGP